MSASFPPKTVSANKCPRALKLACWAAFRYNSSSASLLSQFFKPSWPSQIGSRKSGKAHGQTGSDGRQEQKSIVTPGVPERVTRHVFSCFTPPQFNVRVFVDQYPYIIIHLTICQHFFLFHTKNTLLQVFFKI